MDNDRRARLRLLLLAGLVLAACAAFMTLGARGNWSFVLPYRGAKLAAMLLVACAIGVSTVLFHTITHNRILTPSVMGFDALYVLIQTVLMFVVGAGDLSAVDPRLRFGAEVLLMVSLAVLLFRWLFTGMARSLHLLMLVGIVFGVLFRSLGGYMARVMDPNEFVVLQDRLFASFNAVKADLLGVAALTLAVAAVFVWRRARAFDVLALGREQAINLGLDYTRFVMGILVVVAVLVSVATALVGPVTFFGLLVANLAYQVMPSHRHRYTLLAASLLGALCLVGGQVLLEQVLGFTTALSVVIEFLGGLMFIVLLIRKARL